MFSSSDFQKLRTNAARYRFLIFTLPFLPYFLTILFLDYTAYNNSSDTFLYIDIAHNLLKGRGFVTSFNAYQYWAGIYHPALTFVHSGFSLFLAPIYAIFSSVKSLVFSNLFLGLINVLMLYKIALSLYKDKAIAFWASFIFASSVCMEVTILRVLSEQLSLLVTLWAVYFFISERNINRRVILAAGLLLGIGIFIRSSSIIYPVAFILASASDLRFRSLKKGLYIAFIPLLMIVFYEAAVYIKYGYFFPEYPQAFKNYFLANFSCGGGFFAAMPAVRPFCSSVSPGYGLKNLADMGLVLFCILRVLIVFVLARIWKLFKSKDSAELLLFWLGFIQMVSLVLFYPYMRIGEFSWARFLLLPSAFLLVLGIKEFKEFSRVFFPHVKKVLFNCVLSVVFLSNFYQSYKTLEVYWQQDSRVVKVEQLRAIETFLAKNSRDTDLVAVSEYILGGLYLDRPTIALPSHNLLYDNTLDSFLNVYKPAKAVFEKEMGLDAVFLKNGYRRSDLLPKGSLFSAYEK